MFLEAGGGAARRAQPAAAGFACGFALRAKSGAAVVGRWQRAAGGQRAVLRGNGSRLLRAAGYCGRRWQRAVGGSGLLRAEMAAGCGGGTAGRPCGEAAHRPRRRRGRAPPRRGGGPAGRIAAGRSGPPAKNKTRKTAVLRAWFGAYR